MAGARAVAAASAHGAPDTARGRLVSVAHLRTLSAREVAAELRGDEDGAWDAGAVRHGVDTYRVVYRTVDPKGRPTTTSGLPAFPRNGERRLRTVSFTHGTGLFKGDVASVSSEVWSQAPALTYASAGFAVVLADYLGLLRAADSYAPTIGRQLGRDVLITGFSRGASAALGLARALWEGADPRFRVAALAPVSGQRSAVSGQRCVRLREVA